MYITLLKGCRAHVLHSGRKNNLKILDAFTKNVFTRQGWLVGSQRKAMVRLHYANATPITFSSAHEYRLLFRKGIFFLRNFT